MATFTVEGVPHALVAARLAAEDGDRGAARLFLRPPVPDAAARPHARGRDTGTARRYAAGDRRAMPGAVRASAGINTTDGDIARLLAAVARIAAGEPAPIHYRQDRRTGDFCPARDIPGLTGQRGTHGAPCSLG